MNFQTDDLYQYCELDSVRGRHDRSTIVFTATTIDRRQDRYDTALWCVGSDDGESPSRLVEAKLKPASPVRDPYGKAVAFLADASDGSRQAHRLDMEDIAAGPYVLTPCGHQLKSLLEWSGPRKSLLAMVDTIWTEHDAHELGTGQDDPKVIDFLPYKSDDDGIIVAKRAHAFALDIDGHAWKPLTAGDFDVSEAAWSPDGKAIAFIRSCDGQQRHRTELWLADGNGAHARLHLDAFAHVRGLAWSPDGSTIAIGATRLEGDSLIELCLVDAATGATRFPDDALELEGSTFEWHPDGGRLAAICARRGLFQIAVVDTDTGVTARIGPRLGHVTALAQIEGGLAFVSASLRTAAELHTASWTGSDPKRVSTFNRAWFRQRTRPRAIKRRFFVPDGEGGQERVDAWLLLPPGHKGPFPLLVDMHGGPQSVALIDFAAHAYWYALVSQGWAVLAPNCVGSGSYGRDFAKRLRGRWGELDLPQHLAIVRQLQREGLADERLACAGKSYGGYLAAWSLGHTDMFRAAVVAAPVADVVSHAGTSDSGYYVTPYAMAAELDDTPERYRRLSPLYACKDTRTPALFLQGEKDQRCPLGQAEQLFANLVRSSDAPTRMVVYPGGSHSLSAKGKPSHRLDFHRRLAKWVVDHAGDSQPQRSISAAVDSKSASPDEITCP